jgi:hypothetical protein
MQDDTPDLGPIPWRNLLSFDAKAIAAIGACALILIGLLVALPAWLRGQERADFAGAAVQTAPGIVTVCEISPVSQGGGGLFNAVTVAFAHRQRYYALPPESKWVPKFHQSVRVTYRVGRRSGQVRVDAVTPE